MEENKTGMMTEEQFHKKMAVDLFNRTWDLLDKSERTPEENDELVHAGHASRYHWAKSESRSTWREASSSFPISMRY